MCRLDYGRLGWLYHEVSIVNNVYVEVRGVGRRW